MPGFIETHSHCWNSCSRTCAARVSILRAEGRVRETPHSHRLLPAKPVVHDRGGHAGTPRSSISLTTRKAGACRRRNPRDDGERVAGPLRYSGPILSGRQNAGYGRRAPGDDRSSIAPVWSTSATHASKPRARQSRSRSIRRSSAGRESRACRSFCTRAVSQLDDTRASCTRRFSKNMIFVHSLFFDQRDREVMVENGTSNSFSL